MRHCNLFVFLFLSMHHVKYCRNQGFSQGAWVGSAGLHDRSPLRHRKIQQNLPLSGAPKMGLEDYSVSIRHQILSKNDSE